MATNEGQQQPQEAVVTSTPPDAGGSNVPPATTQERTTFIDRLKKAGLRVRESHNPFSVNPDVHQGVMQTQAARAETKAVADSARTIASGDETTLSVQEREQRDFNERISHAQRLVGKQESGTPNDEFKQDQGLNRLVGNAQIELARQIAATLAGKSPEQQAATIKEANGNVLVQYNKDANGHDIATVVVVRGKGYRAENGQIMAVPGEITDGNVTQSEFQMTAFTYLGEQHNGDNVINPTIRTLDATGLSEAHTSSTSPDALTGASFTGYVAEGVKNAANVTVNQRTLPVEGMPDGYKVNIVRINTTKASEVTKPGEAYTMLGRALNEGKQPPLVIMDGDTSLIDPENPRAIKIAGVETWQFRPEAVTSPDVQRKQTYLFNEDQMQAWKQLSAEKKAQVLSQMGIVAKPSEDNYPDILPMNTTPDANGDIVQPEGSSLNANISTSLIEEAENQSDIQRLVKSGRVKITPSTNAERLLVLNPTRYSLDANSGNSADDALHDLQVRVEGEYSAAQQRNEKTSRNEIARKLLTEQYVTVATEETRGERQGVVDALVNNIFELDVVDRGRLITDALTSVITDDQEEADFKVERKKKLERAGLTPEAVSTIIATKESSEGKTSTAQQSFLAEIAAVNSPEQRAALQEKLEEEWGRPLTGQELALLKKQAPDTVDDNALVIQAMTELRGKSKEAALVIADRIKSTANTQDAKDRIDELYRYNNPVDATEFDSEVDAVIAGIDGIGVQKARALRDALDTILGTRLATPRTTR